MSLKRKREMEQMLQSRQIKFVIGKDKIEYLVHESTLATLSEKLKTDFAELSDASACIFWEHVEPDTFVNLMEYAYWKDYTVSLPSQASKEPQTEHTSQEANDGVKIEDNEGDESGATDEGDDSNTDACDEEDLESLRDYLEVPGHKGAQYLYASEKFIDGFSKNKNAASRTVIKMLGSSGGTWLDEIKNAKFADTLTVFMTHVRLCGLAQEYCITELRDLCLYRLRQSLLHCPGTETMMIALSSLIEHIYRTTRSGDQLRSLLVEYCVTDMEWSMESSHFQDLIKRTPEFSIDLLLGIPATYWVELTHGVQEEVLGDVTGH